MTEQPPSPEAIAVAKAHSRDEWGEDNGGWYTLAQAIDALCEQRVSAETERCANICDERYQELGWDDEAVGRRQECATLERYIRASAERPAPEGPQLIADHHFEGGGFDGGDQGECIYCGKEISWARTQPNPKPSWLIPYDDLSEADKEADRQIGEAVVTERGKYPLVDHTERAREIVRKSTFVYGSSIDGEPNHSWIDAATAQKEIAAALNEVASERDATAIRAWGKRVWSDSEEVAYQAGVNDTLGKLQEPNIQDAIAKAFGEVICSQLELERIGEGDKQRVHFILRGKALDFSAATLAAFAKIAEMLK